MGSSQAETEGTADAGIVTLRGRTVTGLVDPEFAPLLRADAEDPFAWPDFELVKESTVRTVTAGTVDGHAVHLKLFRPVRLSDRARDALSGSRGVREFRNLLEAQRRGLPAVRPLAAGRWTGTFGSRSFLITATVPDGSPMPRSGWQTDQAHAAGQVLRQAHDAGLHAQDLHPENLVVDADGALHLLDLTSAAMAQPLDNEERARALAFFCLELDGGAADPIATPLIEGYGAPESVVERAVRQGRRLRNRALSAFGRRAGRRCRHTITETDRATRRFLFTAAADLHEQVRGVATTTLDPDDAIKAGRRGGVWSRDALIVKRRQAGAARKLFRASYWFAFADAKAAQPVGLELRNGLGFVCYRRIESADLQTRVQHNSLTAADAVAAASSLGRDLGRLHALGLRNRDLKLENLVIDPEDGRVAMVDLDGVRRKAPIDPRGEASDLGRLWAAWRATGRDDLTRTARTFWRRYVTARRQLGSDTTRWLRQLAQERADAWFEKRSTTK